MEQLKFAALFTLRWLIMKMWWNCNLKKTLVVTTLRVKCKKWPSDSNFTLKENSIYPYFKFSSRLIQPLYPTWRLKEPEGCSSVVKAPEQCFGILRMKLTLDLNVLKLNQTPNEVGAHLKILHVNEWENPKYCYIMLYLQEWPTDSFV